MSSPLFCKMLQCSFWSSSTSSMFLARWVCGLSVPPVTFMPFRCSWTLPFWISFVQARDSARNRFSVVIEQGLVLQAVDDRWVVGAASNFLGTRFREGCFERSASSVLYGYVSHSFHNVVARDSILLAYLRVRHPCPPMRIFGCTSGGIKLPLTHFAGTSKLLFGRISQLCWKVLVSFPTRCRRRSLAVLLPHRSRCILVPFPMELRASYQISPGSCISFAVGAVLIL